MKNRKPQNSKRSQGTQTVIEFSNHSIKLIQSRLNMSKLRFISQLAIKENIADSQEAFIEALDKIITHNHLKIGDLIVSLERSLVTIRSVKLPSADEEEIRDMVELQTVKFLPYRIDEMVVSHQTIKTEEGDLSHVILVIVPKGIVKKFTNICEALKLRPQLITLSSEGLLQWYMNIRPLTINDTLLLVDIDKGKTEVAVVSGGKLFFSRSFSLTHITDNGQKNKKIMDESRLSLDYYRKQESFRKIEKIVLTGNKARAYDLSSLFNDTFGLPVEVIDNLQNLVLRHAADEAPESRQYSSFIAASGLVLSPNLPQINLCPQETKDKAFYHKLKKELFKAAALALAMLLVFLGMYGFGLRYKKNTINRLNEQIRKISPAAKQIQDIKNRIALINSQLDRKNSCIEILKEIHQIAPAGIFLSTFLFQESDRVIIKGTAPAMSLAFSFVPILNQSHFFENVEVSYATQRKTKTGELTDFEIICRLDS
ncbi:pilus assembly protein PilM [Candidatus Omnitrophota bacterium]